MRTELVTLLTAVLLAGVAGASDFALDPSAGSDTVRFKSSARLEFIEGSTTDMVGHFSFDRKDPKGTIDGAIRVDLRSLRTGIETRDEHMRNKHLHTEKFPYAFFVLTSVAGLPDKIEVDTSYRAEAEGLFYIHGVNRKIRPRLTIRFAGEEADWEVKVLADFEIELDDFKIDRPRALFLKLAETIEVEVVFSGRLSESFERVEVPDWPTIQ